MGGELNEPRNRSPEVPNSPKLGGVISPPSFTALISKWFVRAKVGAFQNADRPAEGTGERKSSEIIDLLKP